MPTPSEPNLPSVKDRRDAVAEAATLSNGLWISFIFAMFYLLVAAGGVTHEDLLLDNPVKLPFLGVDLPLLRFFWLGPVILLIAHAYTLLHFSLLAQKVGCFEDALVATNSQQDTAERSLLPANIFVQNIAGPSRPGRWLTGWPVWLISCVSLLLAPIALLILFELQFLPYHSLPLTTWHRVALILDLLMLWRVWPTLKLGAPATASGFPSRRLGLVMHRGLACLAVGFVWLVATFPGEPLNGVRLLMPLQRVVVAGDLDDTLRPTSWWSNRLVVANSDLIDHSKYDSMKKLAVAPALHSLRERNFELAVFTEANIPRMDFSFANLRGATFNRAHGQGSWFDHADLSGAQLDDAQLQGASFYATLLQGASLDGAKLQGASLAAAQLQGAWLAHVDAEGASLASADLRRATLDRADLRGANLYDTRLQGASLAHADLRGASLNAAYTWRADFRETEVDKHQVPRVLSLNGASAAAPCENLPAQACTDTPEIVRQLIMDYVPPGAIREKMILRLWASLSEKEPKVDGQGSDLQKGLLNPTTLPSEEGMEPQFWVRFACAGDGAPFVLVKLINTLDDDKELNRPNQEALKALVAGLSQDECAAKPTIPEIVLMQAKDVLREPSLGVEQADSR